ncbi:unnamed protein product [Schistocephalus solidus]|uniref:C2H2-type domain-containing protein n=1 Tax=Schistocephalus solidus TaxID=70667 RepID=A0A183SP06_SCHSO|nr:unnamed protein product [Schistocephalus solidus]
MSKPFQRAHAVNTHSMRIGLVGHIRTQCNNHPITSTSATLAADPTTTTTTLTTDNNFIGAPPPTITDIILPPSSPAPITATNNTCPTPTTSEYLPPATSKITTAPSTSDGDSVLTCLHCNRTFTSHIGLVGHFRGDDHTSRQIKENWMSTNGSVNHHINLPALYLVLRTFLSGDRHDIDNPGPPTSSAAKDAGRPRYSETPADAASQGVRCDDDRNVPSRSGTPRPTQADPAEQAIDGGDDTGDTRGGTAHSQC